MSSKETFIRVVVLGLVLAAVASAPAQAVRSEAHGIQTQTFAGVAPPAASFYTPQALRAQGLRWQAMADFYDPRPTALGLKADSLRWQAIAATYLHRTSGAKSSSINRFHWSDAAIGAASGLVLAVAGAAAVLSTLGRRRVPYTPES